MGSDIWDKAPLRAADTCGKAITNSLTNTEIQSTLARSNFNPAARSRDNASTNNKLFSTKLGT